MIKSHTCPICKSSAEKTNTRELVHYNCNRCGNFFISREASEDFVRDLSEELTKTKISAWIRESQSSKIESQQLEWLIKNLRMINVYEKAQKLLIWINSKAQYPGHAVTINIKEENKDCLQLLSICWARNEEELRYLIEYLVNEKFLIRLSYNNINISVTISPSGYAYLENSKKNTDSNIGFCAMWFDDGMTEVWEQGFEPAIKAAGYHPRRIDRHPHNGPIVDEIISSIRRSKFLVADLTGNRGGVYYEAGFAKGFGIEVIFTCCSDVLISELHFDVRHYNFLQWDASNYKDLNKNLALRIESTIGRGKL